MHSTQLKGLVSDANLILVLLTKEDPQPELNSEGGFQVVCSECDPHGRPCIGPNWGMFNSDLGDEFRKAQKTPAEAWEQTRPLLERLVKWGWNLVNVDKQRIGVDGAVLTPARASS